MCKSLQIIEFDDDFDINYLDENLFDISCKALIMISHNLDCEKQ